MVLPRQNRQPRSGERQHQRFSWQTPPHTPPEEAQNPNQQQQQHQYQQPPQLNTDLSGQQPHSRAFSYAQTPAEHLAFQYIPSPTEQPPLPRSVTPIDPRPQSIYTPHNNLPGQPQTQAAHASSPTHHQRHTQERPPLSPLSPHDRSNALVSPVSPVAEPQNVYHTQQQPHPQQYAQIQQTHHLRNLSNLVPINTNVAQQRMPPIPATPRSHKSQASPLPNKTPITPISPPPSSIKKPDTSPAGYPLPMSANSQKSSYAHEPYSPHGFSSRNTGHAVFSPDSAHGPNGLDFSLHRPGQIAHPNMDLSASGSTHEWKHTLCSCTPNPSDCLTGLLCPCILYGRTSYRLSQKSSKNDPTDLLSYSATNAHCMLMAVSCGFWWVFPLAQRIRIRHAYKLEGGMAGDCVRGACCCCCVALQNEREVREREESCRRWAGPASQEVYQSSPQMVYSPQR